MVLCFMLKCLLKWGEMRRLNLWESRWLAFMDSFAEVNGGFFVGVEFGCLFGCVRYYVSSFCFEILGDVV